MFGNGFHFMNPNLPIAFSAFASECHSGQCSLCRTLYRVFPVYFGSSFRGVFVVWFGVVCGLGMGSRFWVLFTDESDLRWFILAIVLVFSSFPPFVLPFWFVVLVFSVTWLLLFANTGASHQVWLVLFITFGLCFIALLELWRWGPVDGNISVCGLVSLAMVGLWCYSGICGGISCEF